MAFGGHRLLLLLLLVLRVHRDGEGELARGVCEADAGVHGPLRSRLRALEDLALAASRERSLSLSVRALLLLLMLLLRRRPRWAEDEPAVIVDAHALSRHRESVLLAERLLRIGVERGLWLLLLLLLLGEDGLAPVALKTLGVVVLQHAELGGVAGVLVLELRLLVRPLLCMVHVDLSELLRCCCK